jgi:hypothetical protein
VITTQKTARLPKRAQVMRWMAAAMLPIAVVACSTEELLKANYPDQISPDGLSTSLQGASALYAGAIGDFTVAFSGSAAGGFGQVMTTGYMTDEFAFGGTPPEIRQFDLRSIDASNGLGASTYNSLHSAREAAVRADESVLRDLLGIGAVAQEGEGGAEDFFPVTRHDLEKRGFVAGVEARDERRIVRGLRPGEFGAFGGGLGSRGKRAG